MWITVTLVFSLAGCIIFAKYDLLRVRFQHHIWQGKKTQWRADQSARRVKLKHQSNKCSWIKSQSHKLLPWFLFIARSLSFTLQMTHTRISGLCHVHLLWERKEWQTPVLSRQVWYALWLLLLSLTMEMLLIINSVGSVARSITHDLHSATLMYYNNNRWERLVWKCCSKTELNDFSILNYYI